jgi:hypothetical protein
MPDKPTTSMPALGSESKPAPHRRSIVEYAAPRPMRQGFQARLIDFLKSLIWVAPLTLLIWIYAEREQTVVLPNVECPVELQTTGLNRAVRILDPKTGSLHQAKLSVTLDGPSANVYAVARAIGTPVADHPAIQISVGPETDLGNSPLDMRKLLNENPLLVSKGVTVRSCEPQSFLVEVDAVINRTLIVRGDPLPANVVGTPIFNPATVTVHAPSSYFKPADDHHEQIFAIADLKNFPQAKQEGKNTFSGVPITWPLKTDESVTFSPPNVEAVFTIAAPTKEDTCHYALLVWVQMPPVSYHEYRVEYDRSLSDVVVKGPAELVDRVVKGTEDPIPRAVLVVQPDDKDGSEITHLAQFDNLPEGVQVVKPYPITFKLIKRTADAP